MSDIEKELELEFKKAELKRKQLENRKFEAEIRNPKSECWNWTLN